MYLVNLLASEYNGAPDIFWGIFTFVLGMIVVFAGMALIVLCVSLVAKAMTAKGKKEEKTDEDESEAEATVEAETSDDGIPENVKVAIIAAVLAYYEGEGVKNEFVVKKIKKLNF